MLCFFFNDTATTEIYTLTHSFPTRRSSYLLDRRSSFNLIAAQCPAPLLSLHVDHLGSGQRRKLRWDRKWFQARPRRPDREHNQEPEPATPDETGSGVYPSHFLGSPGCLPGRRDHINNRTEESRVGKECVSTCKYRGSQFPLKKQTQPKKNT